MISSGKLQPCFREWGVKLCQKDKPAFDGFMSNVGPAFSILTTQLVPSHYSLSAQNANRDEDGVEAEIRERMGLTADQFNAARTREAE